MVTPPQPPVQTVSGRRFAFALVSWGFSSIAAVGALFIALIPLGSNVGAKTIPIGMSLYLYPLPLLAWVCLAVMTIGWLSNRACHWIWLIVGGISGVFSLVLFMPFFFLYFSAIPLAFYLTYWHATQSSSSN